MYSVGKMITIRTVRKGVDFSEDEFRWGMDLLSPCHHTVQVLVLSKCVSVSLKTNARYIGICE